MLQTLSYIITADRTTWKLKSANSSIPKVFLFQYQTEQQL